MVIDSSSIGMQSSRTHRTIKYASARSVGGTFTNGRDGLNSLFENQLGDGEKAGGEEKSQEEAKLEDVVAHWQNVVSGGRQFSSVRNDPQEALRSIKQQCVDFLLELLFQFRGQRSAGNSPITAAAGGSTAYTVQGYQMQHYHMEEESTAFSTQGTVKTADGRELSFNLEFGMSRRFEEYYEENHVLSVSTFKDPLVINLDTNIAQVSDQKFFFDLDCDGEEEEISNLQAGSGFLALDLNEDGKINDGGELFGTKSGDGFKDLSRYDSDGNGWIDEADPIWEKLLIWTKDEDGEDKMYHLSDLGVGAIGLSRVGTQFSLNSEKTNETNAMIRKTGIFLYENGAVSTIQHLDMAVYNEKG